MEEKTFELSYTMIEDEIETYDVSFELSPDAADRLFEQLSHKVQAHISDGMISNEYLHLIKMLSDQRKSIPPFMEETEEVVTYDLELHMGLYSKLCSVVGEIVSGIYDPDTRPEAYELMCVLDDIRFQMREQDLHDDQTTLEFESRTVEKDLFGGDEE